MRSRAALLTFCGDPFIITYWLRFYKNVWQSEVDKLYLYLNASYLDQELIDYFKTFSTGISNIVYKKLDIGGDHGNGLRQLIEDCQEENIILFEDDGFVFHQGALDEQFNFLERGQYEIIGSPRGSIHMNIFDRQMQLGQNLSCGYDEGPNFWPNFFFAKRELLLKTDRNFGSKNWKAGEEIKELGMVLDQDSSADTFSWTSIQLRTLTKKVGVCQQYKAYPHDWQMPQRYSMAPWIHSGSSSSGIIYYLQDENGKPIRDTFNSASKSYVVKPIESEGELWDFENRTAWWLMAFRATKDEITVPDFKKRYEEAINRFIDSMGLRKDEIEKRIIMYKKVMGDQLWM